MPDTTKGVQWRTADPATPGVLAALGDVDVLVWVAAETDLEAALQRRPTSRRESLLCTAQTLVTAAAAAGASRLAHCFKPSPIIVAARSPGPIARA